MCTLLVVLLFNKTLSFTLVCTVSVKFSCCKSSRRQLLELPGSKAGASRTNQLFPKEAARALQEWTSSGSDLPVDFEKNGPAAETAYDSATATALRRCLSNDKQVDLPWWFFREDLGLSAFAFLGAVEWTPPKLFDGEAFTPFLRLQPEPAEVFRETRDGSSPASCRLIGVPVVWAAFRPVNRRSSVGSHMHRSLQGLSAGKTQHLKSDMTSPRGQLSVVDSIRLNLLRGPTECTFNLGPRGQRTYLPP